MNGLAFCVLAEIMMVIEISAEYCCCLIEVDVRVLFIFACRPLIVMSLDKGKDNGVSLGFDIG